MTVECFFNQQLSDALQHIALIFEIGAIYLVWKDYKKRISDLEAQGKKGFITMGMSGPTPKRTKELYFAYSIGMIAVCMEVYQLATQYLSC